MREVGAISATPRVVADRVAAPIVRRSGPLAVLEVGAGTGAVTDAILTRLGAGDRLDVYEINATFAALLRVRYAEHPVRVVEADVDTLPPDARYDAIVSSLPLMHFPRHEARPVLARLGAALLPGGTLSYYDYWGKEARCWLAWGRERRRMSGVLRETREFVRAMDHRREVVAWNVPPAVVHHVQRRGDPARA